MKPPDINAISEKSDAVELIRSPLIGVWYSAILPGSVLSGGANLGFLKQMNSFYEFKLPASSCGRVFMRTGNEPVMAVEYGQELFQLKSLDLSSSTENSESDDKLFPENEDEGFTVNAFTTGIFYRRSSPDSPPYVAVGDEVENGSVLGLIEVMKSFNQVVFSSTEGVSRGRVVRILADDAQEVKMGQPLIHLVEC
jgi:biotin carboxyl carrier protein